MFLAISSLVSTAIAIVLGVVVWGWSNETTQEQVNRQFESTVWQLNN